MLVHVPTLPFPKQSLLFQKRVPLTRLEDPQELLGLLPSAWSSPNHWGHLGDEPTGGGTGWANALNAEGDYTQAGILHLIPLG